MTRRSTTAWRVTAAALALAAAACLIIWSDRSAPAESSEPTVAATTATGPTTPGATTAPAPLPQPVRLTVPGIGLTTRLTELGLQPDGTVEVPKDPDLAGWYHLGPPPGAHGPAVILGHVDSVDGPAVFARLSELGPGDRVRVALDDGSSVTFVVHSVRTYANADFPARQVYGGHGRRELNLVTCGGAYDADRGGYQANVVVNARWVSGTRS
ncbi:class F sortase [Nocardioides sp. CN2-186]|uniref:class F sortase n=1 Tax=Nocardioides tweenelious TaxID=3156607 RepID=UPI0032B3AD38